MSPNFRRRVSINPVVSASAAYTSGDQVGPGSTRLVGVLEGPAHISLLQSIVIVDAANQKSALDFLFWRSLPAIVTADNAAFAVPAADAKSLFVGGVSVVAGDYFSSTLLGFGSKTQIRLPVQSLADTNNLGKDLFVSIVTRGTPTYAAITDLVVDFVFE